MRAIVCGSWHSIRSKREAPDLSHKMSHSRRMLEGSIRIVAAHRLGKLQRPLAKLNRRLKRHLSGDT
jgi:hypothetical protein